MEKAIHIRKKFWYPSLDEEGKETYYSDQSHVRHYLKRTDPFVFKSIAGVDYNTLVKQQKDDIQMMKELKEKGFKPKEISNTDITKTENEKNIEQIKNTSEVPNINTLNNPDIHHEDNNLMKTSFNPYKTQIGFRPYNKRRNFKDTYVYENKTRFKSN